MGGRTSAHPSAHPSARPSVHQVIYKHIFFKNRESHHYLNDINGNQVYPIELFVDTDRYAIASVVRAIRPLQCPFAHNYVSSYNSYVVINYFRGEKDS